LGKKWVKRARLEIIGNFLAFCRQPKATKQEIMRHVGLTIKDLHETILTTMAVGLIRVVDGKGLKPQYETTEKGKAYVDLYLNLKTLLEQPVKTCLRCNRAMPIQTKLECCPYCGGQIQTTFPTVERA